MSTYCLFKTRCLLAWHSYWVHQKGQDCYIFSLENILLEKKMPAESPVITPPRDSAAFFPVQTFHWCPLQTSPFTALSLRGRNTGLREGRGVVECELQWGGYFPLISSWPAGWSIQLLFRPGGKTWGRKFPGGMEATGSLPQVCQAGAQGGMVALKVTDCPLCTGHSPRAHLP